jgi:tRNA(Ile)-lysidine synthase
VATPSPRAIVSSVRAFARRNNIFQPGPLVVAVSGGTDSVALALILAELKEEFGLVLHIAHFDHRTRPRAAAKDAAFVASVADHIGAPIRVGRAVSAVKSEDDARRERYLFLRRVASELDATAIATGHTLDDQAETVLLHLTRGSGVAGAAGMRPLRDGIGRPLLAIGRRETAAICRAAKIRPREDTSNRSLKFARNRVRLKVLPELAKINPQIRAALARFADAAAQIEGSAGESRKASELDAATAGAHLNAAIELASLPVAAAARERVLAERWQAAGGIILSARHRAALGALAATTAGTQRIDLPGGNAIREYGTLRFALRASAAAAANSQHVDTRDTARQTAPTPLARGTSVEWHGWRITLDMPADGLPFAATVDASSAPRLAVRARRPGDRIAGAGKLQDVFVDAKVPSRSRDDWPVLTLDDVVVWVPGLTPPPRTGRIRLAVAPSEALPERTAAGLTPRRVTRRNLRK